MMRSRKILIAILLVGFVTAFAAWFIFFRGQQTADGPMYVNSVLAVRGFSHDPLNVAIGDSKTYEVYVGEEFKVTWRAENLSENGQLLYSGPPGIGSGLVAIPSQNIASASGAPFLDFTPTKAGTAAFTLTVTGPGPDGIYTVPSTLTVTVIP